MTRKGFGACWREAFGLSKNSLTSANVACLNPAPLGHSAVGFTTAPVLPVTPVVLSEVVLPVVGAEAAPAPPTGVGVNDLRRRGAGACASAPRMRACRDRTSSNRAVANGPCGGERLSTRMRTRISPSSAKMRVM